eukprot:9947503-Alexandrium_andersonii.AAC.1
MGQARQGGQSSARGSDASEDDATCRTPPMRQRGTLKPAPAPRVQRAQAAKDRGPTSRKDHGAAKEATHLTASAKHR